jgi:PAS domain S-box-containing protein
MVASFVKRNSQIDPGFWKKVNVPKSLRVLIVDDNAAGAEAMVAEMRLSGFEPDWQRVKTESGLGAALASPPDLILVKDNMPLYTCLRAFEAAHAAHASLIVVAEAGDAHKANAAMKLVAADIVSREQDDQLALAAAQALEALQQGKARQPVDDALRESETLFRGLFEQAALGMCCLDLKGSFTRVNQSMCDITGYTAAELTRLSNRDITHPEDVEPEIALYQQLLAEAIPHFAMEKRYVRKDGSVTWVGVWAWLLRNEVGAPISIIGMVEPIGADDLSGGAEIDQIRLNGRYHAQLEELLRKQYGLQDSFKTAMINREKHVIELKEEVNRLCAELKRPPAYPPIW